MKLPIPAQDEGDWEDEFEELESRDWVTSETECGAGWTQDVGQQLVRRHFTTPCIEQWTD